VFGDARPGRRDTLICVATGSDFLLRCARCRELLQYHEVAFYSRTRTSDAYDPWCHLCASQLVRWAGAGALSLDAFDTVEAEQTMRELLHRGDW
jgi:hypothetical protein